VPFVVLLLSESFSLLIGNYLCNNYTLFVVFGITMNTFVRMRGINVPRHTCD
jgi:hypothetical protein